MILSSFADILTSTLPSNGKFQIPMPLTELGGINQGNLLNSEVTKVLNFKANKSIFYFYFISEKIKC